MPMRNDSRFGQANSPSYVGQFSRGLAISTPVIMLMNLRIVLRGFMVSVVLQNLAGFTAKEQDLHASGFIHSLP